MGQDLQKKSPAHQVASQMLQEIMSAQIAQQDSTAHIRLFGQFLVQQDIIVSKEILLILQLQVTSRFLAHKESMELILD